MKDLIISFLNMTAVQTEAPKLFGAFHIAAALITAAAAVCAAFFCARRIRSAARSTTAPAYDRTALIKILSICGWVLVILEVYKQLFLYHIVNGGAYDWWFFPFQLCSVPMYLCILLPFVARSFRNGFMTFMAGYTFVSAIAALIYPEDFLRSYAVLTMHGFIWHGILLFISTLIILSGAVDSGAGSLLRATALFAFFCFVAVVFNMATVPLIREGLPHKYAAMFYLDPYHLSVQPLVGSIQKAAGIPAGLILYSLAIAAVSSAVILLSGKIRLRDPDPDDPDL